MILQQTVASDCTFHREVQAGDLEGVLHLEMGGAAPEPEKQRDLCPWRFSVLN